MKTITNYVTAIRQNVDAMYDGRITFEEFDSNQRRLWAEITAAGLADEASDILNKKTN